MTLEQPVFQQVASGTAIQYAAIGARTLADGLVTALGVSWLGGDLKVTQRAAGANFSVDVAAGHAVIGGTSVANQGKYVVRNTATVNLAIAAGGSGTDRFDLVYAQVRDAQVDGGSNYDWVIDKVTGTPGSGLPATPANAIQLAQVGPVVTSTVSITDSLIKDLRKQASAAGAAKTPLTADVTTDQTTSSGTYTNLATVGPTVSNVMLAAGQSALVTVSFVCTSASVNTTAALMSFDASGVESGAAADANAAQMASAVGEGRGVQRTTVYTAAITGLHTFTAKYRSETGGTTVHFAQRRLIVVPL